MTSWVDWLAIDHCKAIICLASYTNILLVRHGVFPPQKDCATNQQNVGVWSLNNVNNYFIPRLSFPCLLQLVCLDPRLSLESRYSRTNFFKERLKWISVEKGECDSSGRYQKLNETSNAMFYLCIETCI